MGLFNKKKDEVVMIGGVPSTELDAIKAKYRPNIDYTKTISEWTTIDKSTVLDFLRNGFDPNMITFYGYPKFMLCRDVESLEILKYFGASIQMDETEAMKIENVLRIRFFFYDLFEDFFLGLNPCAYYLSTDIDIFKWLNARGFDFNIPTESRTQYWSNLSVYWNVCLSTRVDDLETARYLINSTNMDFNREVVINQPPLEGKYLTWHYYLYKVLINGLSFKQQTKVIKSLLGLLSEKTKINATTSEGNNALSILLSIKPSIGKEAVKLFLELGMDPDLKNNSGMSFIDRIKKIKKMEPVLKAIEEAKGKGNTVDSVEKKDTSTQNKRSSSENTKNSGAYKKRTRDESRYDGIFFLELLQHDFIYFHEDEISYDGKNHSVKKAWFNSKEVDKFPGILKDGANIADQLIELCNHVESNPKLLIDSDQVASELLVHLYGENLTGILALNLFADHFLKVIRHENDTKNNYVLMVETRIANSIPNYQEYLRELIQTVIDFNPLKSEELTITYMNFTNLDIGVPKKKRRPSKNADKRIVSEDKVGELILLMTRDKDFGRFSELASVMDLNGIRVANNLTLLHVACYFDLTEFANYLINSEIDVNETTTENLTGDDKYIKSNGIAGVTALQWACQNSNDKIVEALLRVGADVNLANQNGITPLMIAAQKGHLEIFAALLDHNANIDALTSDKKTATLLAAEQNHVRIVELLVRCGANVKQQNGYWLTALSYAIMAGNVQHVKFLIENGYNFDFEQRQINTGYAPTLTASMGNKTYSRELLDVLYKAGYNVNIYDNGLHAIFWLKRNGYPQSEIDYYAKLCGFSHERIKLQLADEDLDADHFKWFSESLMAGDFEFINEKMLEYNLSLNTPGTFYNLLRCFLILFRFLAKDGLNKALEPIENLVHLYKSNGSTIDFFDKYRNTALMDLIINLNNSEFVASPEHTYAVVERLIALGMNVNAASSEYSVLDLAYMIEDEKIRTRVVNQLKAKGAKRYSEFVG